MKRCHVLFAICLLSISTMTAQTDSVPQKVWTFDGVAGLNTTSTNFVNWYSGGKSTTSAMTFAKLHLLYQKGSIAWETNFDSDYGMAWTDQDENSVKKTSDKIKLTSKLGWEFKPSWYLTFFVNFQSQYSVGREMKKGYDPPVSMWLAPSYTDLSIGIDWKTSFKNCHISLYASPLTVLLTTAYVSDYWNKHYSEEYRNAVPEEPYYDFREEMQIRYITFKIVRDAEGRPDVSMRNLRAEVGPALKGSIAYRQKKMTLNSNFSLFTTYQGRGYNVKEAYEATHPGETWDIYFHYSNTNRQFGRFDIDWDTNLTYQLAKFLNVSINTSLRYYPGLAIANKKGEYGERVQFKNVLGIGLGYSF